MGSKEYSRWGVCLAEHQITLILPGKPKKIFPDTATPTGSIAHSTSTQRQPSLWLLSLVFIWAVLEPHKRWLKYSRRLLLASLGDSCCSVQFYIVALSPCTNIASFFIFWGCHIGGSQGLLLALHSQIISGRHRELGIRLRAAYAKQGPYLLYYCSDLKCIPS